MTISAFPTPTPDRTQDPEVFDPAMAAFLAHFPTFVTDANALAVAMNLNSTTDTSVSSVLIGTGSKTFTVSTGKSFQPGMYIVAADTAAPSTNSMYLQVTSYSGTTLVAMSLAVRGSGTIASWVISQSSGGININGDVAQVFSVSQATAAGHAVPLSQTVGRNKFINGEYKVAQVNADAAHIITAAAAINYGIDGWYTQSTGLNITAQRIAGTAPFRYAYKLLAGATGATTTLHGQRIEGKDVAYLESGDVVVKVGIICDVARTVTWTAYYATVEDTFSTKTQIATGSINATTSQANYSFTFNAGANAKLGLCIEYTTGALTNSTGFITYSGHQIEAGVSPTAYEHIDIGPSLARCQRYCRVYDSLNGSLDNRFQQASTIIASLTLSPKMRSAPSLIQTSLGTYKNSAGGPGTNQWQYINISSGASVTWATPPSGLSQTTVSVDHTYLYSNSGVTPSESVVGQMYDLSLGVGSSFILAAEL